MDLKLIFRAARFAAKAHESHRRKIGDIPYVNHLIRVASEAVEAGLSPEGIAAAFLHDTVEDTSVTFEDLEAEFPPRVVELVRLLTQWWPDDADRSVKERERPKYFAAILKDPEAVALKLLDRADNLRDMAESHRNFNNWARRFLERSRNEMKALIEKNTNDYAGRSLREALKKLEKSLSS